MQSSTPGTPQSQSQGQGIFSFLLPEKSDQSLSITTIMKFFIFLLVGIGLFIMTTLGGVTAGYSIAIVLILVILTLCAFKNISYYCLDAVVYI